MDAILSVELTAKIDGFRDAFNKAIRETDNLNRNTKTKVAEIDKAFADLATQVERSMSKSVSSTNSASNSISKNLAKVASSSQNVGGAVAKGSNQAAFALTNLGRVAQDAPFGFIGIQNNLNPLLESFQRLKAETGSNATAFKSLASSMIGPAGLGFALSIVGSAILFYQQYQQKANKATQDAKKTTDDYVSTLSQLDQVQLKGAQNAQKELTSLQTLYSIATNTTISLNQRKKAVDELQKEYPKYFANLKDETILNGQAKSAYDSLTQSIIATARARAAQDLITKNSSRQLENEKKIRDLEAERLKIQAKRNAEASKGIDAITTTTREAAGLSNATKLNSLTGDLNDNLKSTNDLKTDSNKLTAENLRLTEAIISEVKKGADLTGDNNKKLTVSPKLAKGNVLDPLVESGIKLGNLPIFNGGVTVGITSFVSETQKSLETLRNEFGYTDEKILEFVNNYGLGATELLSKTQEFNDKISSALNSGLISSFQSLGSAIGDAFANGTSAIDAIGISLLSSFGSMLVELGQIAIATGVGIKAIKTALQSLNPVVAVAAGVALVALGSAIKGKVSNIGKNSSGSQQGKGQPVTAFANGGIISGPTLGLMGEYAGAKSDPEVVAPLSKLKGLLGLEDTKQSAAMNAMSTIMGATSSRTGNVTNMNVIKNMMGQTDSSGNVIQRSDREVVVLQSETVLRGSDILIITKKAQSVASRIK